MLVSYAKQEIADPVRTLGGYLGYGISGAVCMFMAIFFFAMAALRGLQGIDSLSGGGAGSTVPYVGALGVLVVMMGIVIALMLRAKKRVA